MIPDRITTVRLMACRLKGLRFRYLVLTGLLLVAADNAGYSQPLYSVACNETINAGEDVIFCHPGGDVVLDGFFSNGNSPLFLEWTPATGLSDPLVLNPTASVTQTTSYTLTIQNPNPVNMLVNGDFEAGNTGFYSEYSYNPNPWLGIPQYVITTNPAPHYPPEYAWCGDHTSGSGNMMVVNGNTIPEPDVWCQTISVLPNTDYYFECFMTSVYPTAPSNLQFRFNGNSLATIQLPSDTCEWIQYATIWNSGAASSLTICIVDLNLIGWGNDFALDDLFFSELCTYTDEVTIEVLPEAVSSQDQTICAGDFVEVGGQVFDQSGNFEINLFAASGCDSTVFLILEVLDIDAIVPVPFTLTCTRDTVVLNGSASYGVFGISDYSWTTGNGIILSNPDSSYLLVGSSGTYHLQVTTTNGLYTCTDSTTVVVLTDTLNPGIQIDTPAIAACDDPQQTLLGHIDSLLPGGHTIQWSTSNGLILSGFDSLAVLVSGAGIYTLSVTNLINGCTAQQSIQVVADTNLPLINIITPSVLNCRDSTLLLQAIVLGPQAGFSSQWTTGSGLILQGGSTLTPLIGLPGPYQLTVIDSLNGCVATASIQVIADTLAPAILLLASDTLSCADTLVQLNGTGSDSGHHLFNWSGLPGSISSGATTLSLMVKGSGWYVLTLEDTLNHCLAIDSVNVAEDKTEPLIQFSVPDTLDCVQLSVIIDAGNSLTQGIPVFVWSTGSGSIVSGAGTPVITVDQSGFYSVNLTDSGNGCTSKDSVFVFLDPNVPEVWIETPDTLTCLDTVVTLHSTWQSPNPTVSFSWSTPNGNILSGQNGPDPLVNKPGTYYLTFQDLTSGCEITRQIDVQANQFTPVVSLPQPGKITCRDSFVLLHVNTTISLTYQWSTSDGILLSAASDSILKAGKGGTYQLQVIDPANGCSAYSSQIVFEDLLNPVAQAGQDTTLSCGENDIILDASSSYGQDSLSYSWTATTGQLLSGSGTSQPLVSVPGIYILHVIDSVNGCADQDTIHLEHITNWDFQLDITPPGCRASGNLIYTINGQLNAPYSLEITGLQGIYTPGDSIQVPPGVWDLQVRDASGCMIDTILTMPPAVPVMLQVPAEITLSSGATGIITLQTNIPLDQIQSIVWMPDSWLTPTTDLLVWQTNPPGSIDYEVMLTTLDSCQASASIRVLIDNRTPIFVPNAFSPLDINGINDHFYPYTPTGIPIMISSLAIYDRWGNQLFQQKDFPSNEAQYGWDGRYKGKPLDPGVYIWVMEVALPAGTRIFKGEVTLF